MKNRTCNLKVPVKMPLKHMVYYVKQIFFKVLRKKALGKIPDSVKCCNTSTQLGLCPDSILFSFAFCLEVSSSSTYLMDDSKALQRDPGMLD